MHDLVTSDLLTLETHLLPFGEESTRRRGAVKVGPQTIFIHHAGDGREVSGQGRRDLVVMKRSTVRTLAIPRGLTNSFLRRRAATPPLRQLICTGRVPGRTESVRFASSSFRTRARAAAVRDRRLALDDH